MSNPIHPRFGFFFTLLAVALVLLRWTPAHGDAAPLFNPVNGHYYEGVSVAGGLNWAAAKAAAEARSYLGTSGHLVTITSDVEKQFVNGNFPTAVGNSWWLGGFQPAGSPEPGGGWQWVSGEPWSYTSWGSGEPNNSAGKENVIQYGGGGLGNWNDVDGTFVYGGYIVEYDVPAGPAPAAPTSLTATAVSASRVDLVWTQANPSAAGFKIERKQGTDGYTQIAQVSSVSGYSDTSVGPGITYTYRVRAANGGGDSAYSPEANATTPFTSSPVLNSANGHYYLAVAGPTGGITWADAEAAARAMRFNGVAGHLATVVTAAENTFVTSTFPNAISGHWMLGGFQVLGTGEPLGTWQWLTGEAWSYTNWNTGEPNNTNSNEDVLSYLDAGKWNDAELTFINSGYVVEFEPGAALPNGAPSNLTATLVSSSQASLAWSDGSTNETGFHVERRTGSGPYRPLVILPANTKSYTDNTLVAKTSYTYRVRAITPGGESANSNEVLATSPGDPIDQISFSGPTNYAVPNEPGMIEVSDLDSDGKLDLIVCTGDSVSFYYGRGDGTFEAAVTTPVGTALTQAIGVDVNNDGRPDIVASAANDNQVDVLINLGNRAFAAPARYTAGSSPWGVTAGDFNKDGWLDLGVSNGGGTMCVLLNQRNGAFGAATSYAGGSNPAKIATADFDGDGNLDLAMSNYVSGNVAVYKGNGAGGFTRTGTLGVGQYPAQLVVDDFNHDGKLDIATANTFSHNVTVLMGNGAGGFDGGTTYPGNTYPHVMRGADLDGDGWSDLVFPNNGTGYFSILRNQRNGLFSGPRAINSGGHNVRMLAVGDFDGDGRTDVVTGNAQEFTLSVFLNTTPGPAPRPATGLTATALSTSAIKLTWTRSADTVAGYKIQRQGAGGYVQIGQVGAGISTFTDSGLAPGTNYTYRVVAYNGNGDALPSNEASATTLQNPPHTPSGLTATAVNSNRVDLQWTDNSGDEDGFEIERAIGNGAFVAVAAVGVNTTTYQDTTVSPAAAYTYRVRAVAGGLASGYATSAQVTTPALAANAPSGLTATLNGLSATLAWTDNSGNEDGFLIERKTAGGDFTLLKTVAANVASYVDAGLAPNTTYAYRVRASLGAKASDPSNEASVTTLPLAPSAPTGLQATAVGQTEIDLVWNDASANEDGFRLERSADGATFTLLATLPANTQSYQDTGLTAGTAYSYRVRAFNAGGESANSATARATTAPATPDAPSGLQVTARTQTSLTLGWTAGAGATGYEVERQAGGSFTRVGTPTGTTFTETGLAANTAYAYRVRAVNAGGFSAYTATLNTATLPNPPATPGGFQAALFNATTIRLTWSAPAGPVTAYRLERSLDGGGSWQPIGPPAAGDTAFLDGGLQANTTYQYRLRASNAGGESPVAGPVSATTPAPLPDPPSVPQNLRVTGLTATTIYLAWNGSAGATSYVVERKSGTAAFAPVFTVNGDITTFGNGGVITGVAYAYRIKAVNAGGESGYSNIVSATVPAGGKLKVSPTSMNFGKVARGKTTQKSLTLSNKGKGNLIVTVGGVDAPFSVVLGGGTVTLRPGQSQKVTVKFAPVTAAAFAKTLTVTSTDPAAATVSVSLTGTGK